ncbi:hypothetical protein Efla_001993 [Eimeria flavescens]
MSSASGTRRSLLHDVLSHSEVVELGLDGSIDDLPPLSTRFIPSCARAVNAFCWFYFFCFWGAAAAALRHVASSDPQTLLPGALDIGFISVCTACLVCAEFVMYCYVKGKNGLPDSRGPMGDHFTPSTACIVAHVALSATSRMCAFLELLFLLHALILPTPMLACAAFTVCLTRGPVPFLFQLRGLTGYLLGDAFDPLQCSTCIPLASAGACFSCCGRRVLAFFSKSLRLLADGGRAVRCGLCRLCSVRLLRRSASVAPSRRLDASCWVRDPGQAGASDACEAGLPAGQGSSLSQHARAAMLQAGGAYAAHKGPLVRLALAEIITEEAAPSAREREAAAGPLPASRAVSTEASSGSAWTDQLLQEHTGDTPQDAGSAGAEERRPCDVREPSVRHAAAGATVRAVREPDGASRGAPVFVSPRLALELTNCLLFLDLPTLTLHVKTNFLPLEQLEAHEFLSSLVSFVRLYSGDCCMLLYLSFGLCTFGTNVLFILLVVFLLLKLTFACFATVLAHIAAVFGLWDIE